MKKLLILAAISIGLFLFGCSDLVTNNSPQPASSGKQVVKLPAKTGLSKSSDLSVSKEVNGKHGSVLTLHGSYTDVNGNEIKTFANLFIPRDAFDGTTTITMTTDNEYAGLDFSPHMTFERPLRLTLSFSGLNLQQMGITRDNVGFYFVDDSGNLSTIENNGILLNYRTGTITVIGAKIDHFSRYAFAK